MEGSVLELRDSMPPWLVGACINVLGSIFINLGTNLVKLSHMKAELVDGHKDRKKWFTVGMAIFVCGNILNFISMGYAAQTLLAALGSVQFVTNVVFARFVLHETVTYYTLAGTVMILAGNALIVAFANHESEKMSVHELLELFKAEAFVVYLMMTVVLSLVLHLLYRLYRGRSEYVSHFAPSPNCRLHLRGELTPNGVTEHYVIPFLYAMVSALIGTQSVLLAKSLSTVLRATLTTHHNMFEHWATYAVLLGYLATSFFWLARLNTALRDFDALFIVPLLQVLWTIFSLVSGGIFFQEFAKTAVLNITMLFAGIGVVLWGVVLLAGTREPYDQVEWDEDDDEEWETLNMPSSFISINYRTLDPSIHTYSIWSTSPHLSYVPRQLPPIQTVTGSLYAPSPYGSLPGRRVSTGTQHRAPHNYSNQFKRHMTEPHKDPPRLPSHMLASPQMTVHEADNEQEELILQPPVEHAHDRPASPDFGSTNTQRAGH